MGGNQLIVFGPQYGIEIARAAKAAYNPMTDNAMARLEGGRIIGGFTFSDYTGPGGSMLVHVAGFRDRWLSRALLVDTANYLFNHSKCARIFGQVPATKPKVLAFDLKLGWKEVAFLEGVFPDGGCHILAMTREECRWLRWVPPARAGEQNG